MGVSDECSPSLNLKESGNKLYNETLVIYPYTLVRA